MTRARARTITADLETQVVGAFRTLRARFAFPDDSPEDGARAALEGFCAVALKVMSRSNPSKVRGAALDVEIKARMDGKPVALR